MKNVLKTAGVLTLSVLLAHNTAFACHSSCGKGMRSQHSNCGDCRYSRTAAYKPFAEGKYTPYYEALSSYYTQYAVKQSERGADPKLVTYFYDKAGKAQHGKTRIEYAHRGADYEELSNARKLLVKNTNRTTMGTHPKHLAAAHFYYDCWASGYKFKHKPCHHCRDHFYKYINMVLNDQANKDDDLNIWQSKHLERYFTQKHLVGTFYFEFDKYKHVLNTDKDEILACAAALAGKGYELVAVGYADITGTKNYNSDLSSRRAKEVKSLLVKHGVNPEGVDVVTFGKSKHSKDYATVTWDNSVDRRVELYAVKIHAECGSGR